VTHAAGGSIEWLNPTSALYRAGSETSRIDLIEAWDDGDRLGRAWATVISPEAVERAGKAIVIAGRKGPDDTLWPTTDYLANLGYGVLRHRGFAKRNIMYLSPEPDRDIDGNGRLDDINFRTEFTHCAEAFTNWATTATNLFIYLVDHGGKHPRRVSTSVSTRRRN